MYNNTSKNMLNLQKGGLLTVKNGAEMRQSTFVIKILNKQHSTWQGSITWVEEQRIENFRSALELLKLIDGALEEEIKVEGGHHEEENAN